MTTTAPTAAVRHNACNAESALDPASLLIAWLSEKERNFNLLQSSSGLSPDSPKKYDRERWEIVQGKLHLLHDLKQELPEVAAKFPPDLTGKKTYLPFLRERLRKADELCRSRGSDAGKPSVLWHRADAERQTYDFLVRTLSGNAEEQPGTCEEVPPAETPPAGNTVPADFVLLLDAVSDAELLRLSVRILSTLVERRLLKSIE